MHDTLQDQDLHQRLPYLGPGEGSIILELVPSAFLRGKAIFPSPALVAVARHVSAKVELHLQADRARALRDEPIGRMPIFAPIRVTRVATTTINVNSNHHFSARTKHVALGFFYTRGLAREGGRYGHVHTLSIPPRTRDELIRTIRSLTFGRDAKKFGKTKSCSVARALHYKSCTTGHAQGVKREVTHN